MLLTLQCSWRPRSKEMQPRSGSIDESIGTNHCCRRVRSRWMQRSYASAASKFEMCMSGRWTHNKREFHLEMQTEAHFYHNCFALMYLSFKPIASAGDHIELLKVASQIECAQVLDIGLMYLATVLWPDESY